MEFTLRQIAELLKGELVGDGDVRVHTLSKIEEAKAGSVSFLSNPKYESHLYGTSASAVIVARNFVPQKQPVAALIRVDDPYGSFALLLEEYRKRIAAQKVGIEHPSYMGDSSTAGEDFYLGAFSYIGHRVRIGRGVKIYPQVFVGDDVTIGDGCVLYPGVKVYYGSRIGNSCTLQAGAVIGSDGFGFAPQADGSYRAIPQLGNVVLEDDVDIGANTVVDRATLGSTIIRKGVKLDNLIQIAHNVEIGANTVMAAQSGISGSSKLGRNCVVAGQVGIVGHLEVADRVTLAAQAGVTKSVTETGAVKLGSPAIEHKSYLRAYAVFRNLPELAERLAVLEEKILNLPPD
jgi:UDP-3-O-[3-hydroxymyristoyl] glucosamine N-acyltransferase